MAASPEMFPLSQEKFTVTPGALEDVLVMTLAGRDRRLHATEDGRQSVTVMGKIILLLVEVVVLT